MTCLVYVWIGSELPDWAKLSLQLAKKTSGLEVILLCNHSIGFVEGISRQYYIEDFYSQPQILLVKYKHARADFRGGFWIKTIERFFILQQFLTKYSISSFFHAELDNMVFNISLLADKLNLIGYGLFCPRDSFNRGIASLIYVNNANSLKEFTDLALERLEMDLNDMELLGELLKRSKNYYSLPTEASLSLLKDKQSLDHLPAELIGGIFDAAALGQFLFGIDPRNCNGILFNGFENENKGCNLWRLKYSIDLQHGRAEISQIDGSNITNLYNIHVHSKLFNQLLIDGRINEIIHKIHNSKKTIMTKNIFLDRRRLVRFFKKVLGIFK